MAKSNQLNARFVDTTAIEGMHHDGGGLYLKVGAKKEGASALERRWIFRFMLNGRRRDMGLGPAGKGGLGLAEARIAADEARAIVRKGLDPIAARQAEIRAQTAVAAAEAKAASRKTFGEWANNYLETHNDGHKNAKHRAQWRMTLTQYTGSIWDKAVDEVTTEDILSVLKDRWNKTPVTASRLRGRIERVLDAATVAGDRSGANPARWKGHLEHLLSGKKTLVRGHHAAIPADAIPEFMKSLRSDETVAARALEFLALTAGRSGEIREAVWSEFDMSEKVWTIPAERMKAGRIHRVPLSGRAIEILHEMKAAFGSEPSSYVFPGGKTGRPLSDMIFKKVLTRNGKGEFTAHGLRSSFRDWAGDKTDYPWDVIETALAHAVGDATVRAYRRGDAMDKRRALMDAWANYCGKSDLPANVVPIRA